MKEVKDDIKKEIKNMKGGFGIKKYLKVRNDIVFKALIHENKEYLKKIVKEALKIEIE